MVTADHDCRRTLDEPQRVQRRLAERVLGGAGQRQAADYPATGPQRHRNRRPVFVDDSSTEGLLFKLSPTAVIEWLRTRGHAIENR